MSQVSDVQLNNVYKGCVKVDVGGCMCTFTGFLGQCVLCMEGKLTSYLTIRIIAVCSQHVNLCHCKIEKKDFVCIFLFGYLAIFMSHQMM